MGDELRGIKMKFASLFQTKCRASATAILFF